MSDEEKFEKQIRDGLEQALAHTEEFNPREILVALIPVLEAYGFAGFWKAWGNTENEALPIDERVGYSTEPRKAVAMNAVAIIKETLGNFDAGYIHGKATYAISIRDAHANRMASIENNRKDRGLPSINLNDV